MKGNPRTIKGRENRAVDHVAKGSQGEGAHLKRSHSFYPKEPTRFKTLCAPRPQKGETTEDNGPRSHNAETHSGAAGRWWPGAGGGDTGTTRDNGKQFFWMRLVRILIVVAVT